MGVYDRAIAQFMHAPVTSIGIDDDVARAGEILAFPRFSCLPVIGRDGGIVGVLSRRDMVRGGRSMAIVRGKLTFLDLPSMCVGDLMSWPAITIAPDRPVSEAAKILVDKRIHRVFVVEGDQAVGVFSTKESMAVVQAARPTAPVASIMSRPVLSVDVGCGLGAALQALERAHIASLVVTEGGLPVGLFGEIESLIARKHDVNEPVEAVMSQALLCLPPETPLHRAAGMALSTRARRILVAEHRHLQGIVSGLDFARVVAAG